MVDSPNLLFIMADQLRADFLSCYGASFIKTPNIDALANAGVRYKNCYSEHPVCVAARVSLMTGMNAVRTGVLDNRSFLRPDYAECGLVTWPELLSERSYQTVAIGKMHFYPWDAHLGFQNRVVAEDKCWGFIEDDYCSFLAERGLSKRDVADSSDYHRFHGATISPHPWECSVDHFVGSETVRWLNNYDGDRPFAMMVGFPGPHHPYDPAREYATFQPEEMLEPLPSVPSDLAAMRGSVSRLPTGDWGESWYRVCNDHVPTPDTFQLWRAYYGGLVAQIDHEVGDIVEALRRNDLLDNTVIIFSSDHGDYLGDHGLTGKGTFYESGCRVPMVVRYPGLDAAVRDDLVTLTDVTATMISLAGCTCPDYMDSQVLPGLGLKWEVGRDFVVSVLNTGWAICDGTWKLCKYSEGSHLFNLYEDPEELENRIWEDEALVQYEYLDRKLSAKMIDLLRDNFFAQHVAYAGDGAHSSSRGFGSGEWQRKYPVPWKGWAG